MTALSIVQKVALKVGLTVPSVVFSSTDRTMQEIAALLNECATDIADSYDWQALKSVHTVTGDGTSIGHDLPSDYERMLLTANVWSSPYLWGMEHVTDTDRWLEYLVLPYRPVTGAWTIYQNQFQMLPELPLNDTAKFFYLSNAIVAPAAGVNKVEFTADDDTFRLSERLLEKTLTWQWKAKKGFDYSEDMANAEQEKATLMNKDGGSKPILSGRLTHGWGW